MVCSVDGWVRDQIRFNSIIIIIILYHKKKTLGQVQNEFYY